MNLSGIIAISGRPGLYKVIAQGKNNVIVESLVDRKRFPAYSSDRISALEDISLYTYDEDKPMVEFYDARYPHTEYGQFITRYYIGTILGLDGYYGRPVDNGLCLDGGNRNEWSVSSCEMQVVKDYISQHI